MRAGIRQRLWAALGRSPHLVARIVICMDTNDAILDELGDFNSVQIGRGGGLRASTRSALSKENLSREVSLGFRSACWLRRFRLRAPSH
jgi:hypothetical protein